jgi:predicted negative regulator of RcsB-dependent stress response
MRKILFGVVITLIILFSFKYCEEKKENQIVLQENSALIQKQIKNVGKLIVTEGHFSEVFNYKNSKDVFGDYFTSEKKSTCCGQCRCNYCLRLE